MITAHATTTQKKGTLHHLARLPTRDATNGFCLFARPVLDRIAIESDRGFCYSIELVAKCHRLDWRIGEVPAQWFERAATVTAAPPHPAFEALRVRLESVMIGA